MNFPVHAAVKKVVVRHMNTATCKGNMKSNCTRMDAMVPRVYGSLAGCLAVGGARFHVALYRRSAFLSLMHHSRPCIACHA